MLITHLPSFITWCFGTFARQATTSFFGFYRPVRGPFFQLG
ncbi:butyryl-CoA:acetate CoA-transferase [Acetobacter orientalis]|uniref:Butyryl-CoA:acetate CoA-transferase n=1 Tax=Acetobacter orientalis TaxID=146474 RepID=A0A2Z5ZI46_9PROT|nr:butyryl-CoA:acetate CoA-transferase [Acetobacter orientalis]